MIIAFAVLLSTSAFPKPKYGPEVTLLSRSHEYIQKNSAPDYWLLSPYYIGQQTESACSLAVVATIINAARSATELKADDELVSQSALLKKLADATYEKEVAAG